MNKELLFKGLAIAAFGGLVVNVVQIVKQHKQLKENIIEAEEVESEDEH